jgi:hypothetical protein
VVFYAGDVVLCCVVLCCEEEEKRRCEGERLGGYVKAELSE